MDDYFLNFHDYDKLLTIDKTNIKIFQMNVRKHRYSEKKTQLNQFSTDSDVIYRTVGCRRSRIM